MCRAELDQQEVRTEILVAGVKVNASVDKTPTIETYLESLLFYAAVSHSPNSDRQSSVQ